MASTRIEGGRVRHALQKLVEKSIIRRVGNDEPPRYRHESMSAVATWQLL